MKRWTCRHDRLRGIYGDEIIARGWKRSECLDCGKTWDTLPVQRPDHKQCPRPNCPLPYAHHGSCVFIPAQHQEER